MNQMKKFLIIAIIFPCMTFLVSCGSGSSKTETSATTEIKTEEEKENGDPNSVSLTEEQIKSIGIEFGIIEQKQLTATVKANGVLKVPNQNKASVNSIYNGVIKSL